MDIADKLKRALEHGRNDADAFDNKAAMRQYEGLLAMWKAGRPRITPAK